MFNLRKFVIPVSVAGAVSLAGLSVAHAEQAGKSATSVQCLKLDRIQNVDVIDNTRIVFQSGVNDYYLNTLPYNCNGLKLNDAIMFDTSLNEICNVDTITVLGTAGPGFSPGPSCGLGYFEPISKEQIKTLKKSL